MSRKIQSRRFTVLWSFKFSSPRVTAFNAQMELISFVVGSILVQGTINTKVLSITSALTLILLVPSKKCYSEDCVGAHKEYRHRQQLRFTRTE